MLWLRAWVAAFVGSVLGFAPQASAESGSSVRRGFLDFNGYYDSREASVVTINTRAQLPLRLEYFSLVNYFNVAPASTLQDIGGFFTEQNLRFTPVQHWPIDLAVQWAFRNGDRNDVLRAGVRFAAFRAPGLADWMRARGVLYFVTAYPAQFDFRGDGFRAQVEHVYRWQVLPDTLGKRLYIAGFLDHNLARTSDESWQQRLVTEHQVGVRLVEGLHAVVEWRRNEFLPAENNGWGFGMQYFLPFQVPETP